eukprot:TRINITY_DN3169_c0_g3_i1.p1 TRINITY_DN3169_c0_g3~~TRINITY_DN3169_c0_g3_i1.p1  ORF type:complete len:273 (+),score=122.38 TRINITY_DN3169_c0_g3_i1:56-820(+)
MGNSQSAVKQRVERARSTKVLSLEDSGMSNGEVDGVLKKLRDAQLRALELSGNKLKGALPPTALGIATLKKLRFDRNKISDVNLSQLVSVEEVGAAHNALTTVGAAALGGLAKLKRLDLSHNAIHALSLGPTLASLVECNLAHNQLRSLPPPLLSLPKLATLDASHNLIEALPEGTAPCLQTLDVSHNKLASLPPALLSSTRLQNLQMDSNPLTRAELREAVGGEVYDAFMSRQKKTVDKQISGGLTAQMIKET